MIFRGFREADWRLRLYTLSVPVFWFLALGPGGDGISVVGVSWEGAAINALLLLPLWSGSRWAVTLLGIFALWPTIVFSLFGPPPLGPMFGSLALLAGIQFLLLFTYDLGPNSRPEDADGEPGLVEPLRPLGR